MSLSVIERLSRDCEYCEELMRYVLDANNRDALLCAIGSLEEHIRQYHRN